MKATFILFRNLPLPNLISILSKKNVILLALQIMNIGLGLETSEHWCGHRGSLPKPGHVQTIPHVRRHAVLSGRYKIIIRSPDIKFSYCHFGYILYTFTF